jgi:hypothetical protein
MMRKASLGLLFVFAAMALGYWGVVRSAHAFAKPELSGSYDGNWAVVGYEVSGVSYGHFADCEFVGHSSGESGIFAPNGLMSTVTLQDFDPTGGGIAYLLIESVEDTPAMGGGGPRKAIARITAAGQLEIMAARSGGADYPADFGDDTKKDSIYWLFSKNED